MKKLSISLFAVLAILVAVGSAFTTVKKAESMPVTKYWVVALSQDVLNTSPQPSASALDGASRQTAFSSPYDVQQTLTDFDDNCSFLDANQICVGQFTKVDGTSTATISVIGGDYIP